MTKSIRKSKAKRATTLSISLTPELAAALDERVQNGMYGSASELLRAALRQFLANEPVHWQHGAGASRVAEKDALWHGGPLGERLQDAAALASLREKMIVSRLRAEMPASTKEEIAAQVAAELRRERMRDESDDPHLRPVSAARLRRIRAK
jgi:Arc/MetJ-type ribon-helix-helix transcriptional regulator